MTEWSTPEHLAAARDTIAASIDGWQAPAVWAVGMSSATSGEEFEFPVVNTAGQHVLPALVLAKTIGHASGSVTHALSTTELQHAVTGLSPAEACTTVEHANLAAWRHMLEEIGSNPARSLVAVFIGDLDDIVTSDAEASLRTQLPG